MNIEIIGYRMWAKRVHYLVKNALPEHDVQWFENTIYRADTDLTFLVGWSEIIENPAFYRDRLVLVLHPSPLPFYRGGSPIQHQIIEGEDRSAVSIFRLDEAHPEVDSGPLAWQQGYSLEGSLAQVLERIAEIGYLGIVSIVRAHERGTLAFWEQPEIDYLPKYRRRTPEQSEIAPEEMRGLTARQLHDKIRALQAPYPNAYWTAADGQRLYITETWLGKDE